MLVRALCLRALSRLRRGLDPATEGKGPMKDPMINHSNSQFATE